MPRFFPYLFSYYTITSNHFLVFETYHNTWYSHNIFTFLLCTLYNIFHILFCSLIPMPVCKELDVKMTYLIFCGGWISRYIPRDGFMMREWSHTSGCISGCIFVPHLQFGLLCFPSFLLTMLHQCRLPFKGHKQTWHGAK